MFFKLLSFEVFLKVLYISVILSYCHLKLLSKFSTFASFESTFCILVFYMRDGTFPSLRPSGCVVFFGLRWSPYKGDAAEILSQNHA